MAGARDPFSILNNDPKRGIWNAPAKKAKVNRYKPGVKPILEGQNSSDESSDNDMFKETGSILSLDTKKTTKSQVTGFTGQVLKKKTKIPLKIKKSVIEKNPEFDKPKEIKLDTGNEQVVTRKRRVVKSLEEHSKAEPEADVIQEESELGKRTNFPTENLNLDKKEQKDLEEEEQISEEETSSEEEEEGTVLISKISRPKFVSKEKRQTDSFIVKFYIKRHNKNLICLYKKPKPSKKSNKKTKR